MDGFNSILRCGAFLRSQLRDMELQPERVRLGVTISRQSHTRGHEIAAELARHLTAAGGGMAGDWCIFDHDLVKKVLDDHELPARLEKFMPEDRIGEVTQLLGEILGLHPPMWDLFQNTCETIYRLAHVGNVIIIGRAGNIVTANMPGIVHVRLIGSLEQRVRHLQAEREISEADALRILHTNDKGQARYLKTYFGRDINDVSLYHMVINTDHLSNGSVAEIITCALRDAERFIRKYHLEHATHVHP